VGPPPGGNQNTQGLVGMIVGIVAIPLGCCAWIGMVVGIVGLIFSWLGLQKASSGLATNRGQAIAGLICSAVAIVFGLVMLIAYRGIDWQSVIDRSRNGG
jgi:uncharacterized membrane protein